MQNNQVSSRGRVIKKTGLDDKKINALNEIKNAQKGGAGARRLDQFKLDEEDAIFENVDTADYEKLQDARKNDNFIVDDDGFGYADNGGEIWEYEDHHQKNGGGKKKKQVQQKGNRAMDQYL